MGHSKAEKNESHDRIVRTAAARFREAGVDGIGVADLMKESGMTHGGFYRHFASRDDLVAEAVERALRDGGAAAQRVGQLPHGAFETLVDGYLSAAHRDHLGSSCAVTTLAGDVARSGQRARDAYTRQVDVYLSVLTRIIGAEPRHGRRARAITALSTMVGALSLARAVNDAALSQEILQSAAQQLKASLG